MTDIVKVTASGQPLPVSTLWEAPRLRLGRPSIFPRCAMSGRPDHAGNQSLPSSRKRVASSQGLCSNASSRSDNNSDDPSLSSGARVMRELDELLPDDIDEDQSQAEGKEVAPTLAGALLVCHSWVSRGFLLETGSAALIQNISRCLSDSARPPHSSIMQRCGGSCRRSLWRWSAPSTTMFKFGTTEPTHATLQLCTAALALLQLVIHAIDS